MKTWLYLAGLCGGAVSASGAEEFFDRVGDALSVSSAGGQFRARLSGTMDLEGYQFRPRAPGVIHAAGDSLFTPRLSVFLDAQLGSQLYLFAQARVDRGFDPANEPLKARLDEYALRLTPWTDGRASLQIGRFATVVGNWANRHGSWSNPFITAPLPYELLTGVWDNEALRSSATLLAWSHVRPGLPARITAIEKRLRLPIIWGPSYATGAALFGGTGKLQYAFEVKHAPLSSRPETWGRMQGFWDHPTVSARLGFRPSQTWTLGLSGSSGAYLLPHASKLQNSLHGRGDYRQLVIGHDFGFARRHLQVWGEIYAARFEIPLVGPADTLAYYVEAKYKLTPQLFGALRWNEQLYGSIPERSSRVKWGLPVTRGDLAAGYRFTAHTQGKLQYSLQRGDVGSRDYGHLVSAQLTQRF
ncbi:MAG: hypothetical protein RIQ93_1393 [Verrucomicrobiota bacterium]|jgi:hypothetical protein